MVVGKRVNGNWPGFIYLRREVRAGYDEMTFLVVFRGCVTPLEHAHGRSWKRGASHGTGKRIMRLS